MTGLGEKFLLKSYFVILSNFRIEDYGRDCPGLGNGDEGTVEGSNAYLNGFNSQASLNEYW